MRAWARILVQDHGEAVERVAGALLRRGRLTGDEIDAVVRLLSRQES